MLRSLYLFLFFIGLLRSGQLQANATKVSDQEFNKLYHKVFTKSDDIINHGNYLLHIASNPIQQARAYNIIGDGYFKRGNYVEAIKNIEKLYQLCKNEEGDNFVIAVLNLLVIMYKHAGLDEKSWEYMKVLEDFETSATEIKGIVIKQSLSAMYVIKGDFCKAKDYRKMVVNGFLHYDFEKEINPTDILLPIRVISFYDLARCGLFSKAEKELYEVKKLVQA